MYNLISEEGFVMKFTRLSIATLVCLVFGHQLSGSTTVATPVAHPAVVQPAVKPVEHPALPVHAVAAKSPTVMATSPYITASQQRQLIEKAQAARAVVAHRVTHKITSKTGKTPSGKTIQTAPKAEASTVIEASGVQLRYGDYVQLAVPSSVTQNASGTTENCLAGLIDQTTGNPTFVVAAIKIPTTPITPTATPMQVPVQSLTSLMSAPTPPTPAATTSPRSETNFDPVWFRICGECKLQADGSSLADNKDGHVVESDGIVSLRSVGTGAYLGLPTTVSGATQEIVNFVLAVVSQTAATTTVGTATTSKHYAQTKYTITLQASATPTATSAATATLSKLYLSATGGALSLATTPATWMIDAMKPFGSTGEEALSQAMASAGAPPAMPTTVSKVVALGSAISLTTAPTAMAIAPNGKYVVTGTGSSLQVYTLNGSTFAAAGSATTLSGAVAGANSLQLTADSKYAVVATQDGNITMYAVSSAGALSKTISTPSGAAGGNYAVATSPSGSYFVAGNYNDGQIRYYSYTASAISALSGNGQWQANPLAISWSPTNNMIFTYSASGYMWTSLVNGSTIALNSSGITLPSQNAWYSHYSWLPGLGTVRNVAFSPNGSYLALAGTTGVDLLNCPNASSMTMAGGVLSTGGNTCIAWSPDSKYVAVTTPSQLEICTAATSGLTAQSSLTQTSGISNPVAVGWAGGIIAVANSNSLSLFQVE